MTVDDDKLHAFMARAVTDMAAAVSIALAMIGDKLGLYKAMAGAGPLTSAQVAERTGTSERYVREWLANQVAGGYVTYDPQEQSYTLRRHHRVALASDDKQPVRFGQGDDTVGEKLLLGVDRAQKLEQDTISSALDDAAAVFRDRSASRNSRRWTLSSGERAFLIGPQQSAITDHIAGENCGQPPLYTQFGHINAPAERFAQGVYSRLSAVSIEVAMSEAGFSRPRLGSVGTHWCPYRPVPLDQSKRPPIGCLHILEPTFQRRLDWSASRYASFRQHRNIRDGNPF